MRYATHMHSRKPKVSTYLENLIPESYHLFLIMIILSAYSYPLLNIDLPKWFLAWPVRCYLHPMSPHRFDEVVDPSGRWPSHAVLSHTWSPLQYLFAPSAIRSSRYMACLLPFHLLIWTRSAGDRSIDMLLICHIVTWADLVFHS